MTYQQSTPRHLNQPAEGHSVPAGGWKVLWQEIRFIMKIPILAVASAITLILGAHQTHADTEYLEMTKSASGAHPEQFSGAWSAAQVLTKWEKDNPNKVIITITANTCSNNTYTGILGFWITTKPRSVVKTEFVAVEKKNDEEAVKILNEWKSKNSDKEVISESVAMDSSSNGNFSNGSSVTYKIKGFYVTYKVKESK